MTCHDCANRNTVLLHKASEIVRLSGVVNAETRWEVALGVLKTINVLGKDCIDALIADEQELAKNIVAEHVHSDVKECV